MVKYSQALAKLGKRPRMMILVLSIFMSLIVTVEIASNGLSKTNDIIQHNILVANKDLMEGDFIALRDLDISSFSRTSLDTGERFITDQDLDFIQHKSLLKKIEKGQPLKMSYFSTEEKKRDFIKIPFGKRAFFLETDSLYWVHAGVSVDLVLNSTENKHEPPILIENVMVLSVETEQEKTGVTVALSPEEIDTLQPRLQSGKIGLAVRNPEDRVRGRASKKAKQLFPKRVKVEMITEE